MACVEPLGFSLFNSLASAFGFAPNFIFVLGPGVAVLFKIDFPGGGNPSDVLWASITP